MEFPADSPLLRIGELSRRPDASDPVLRGWENRYGLLQPVRSPGGLRLYSEAEERRLGRLQAYLADGPSAAEAVRAALSGDASTPPGRPAWPPLAASAGDGPCAALRQAPEQRALSSSRRSGGRGSFCVPWFRHAHLAGLVSSWNFRGGPAAGPRHGIAAGGSTA